VQTGVVEAQSAAATRGLGGHAVDVADTGDSPTERYAPFGVVVGACPGSASHLLILHIDGIVVVGRRAVTSHIGLPPALHLKPHSEVRANQVFPQFNFSRSAFAQVIKPIPQGNGIGLALHPRLIDQSSDVRVARDYAGGVDVGEVDGHEACDGE